MRIKLPFMLLSLPVKSISSYNLVIFSVLRTLVSQTAIIVAIVVVVGIVFFMEKYRT